MCGNLFSCYDGSIHRTLLALCVLLIINILFFTLKSTHIYNIPSNIPAHDVTSDYDVIKRESVLIISLGRSGSTLLGSIFDSHPNVMYYYEPIRAVSWENIGMDAEQLETIKIDQLRELLTCNITLTGGSYLKHSSNKELLKFMKFTKKAGICDSYGKCALEKLNTKILNRICREEYTHVVIKELQMRLWLKGMMEKRKRETRNEERKPNIGRVKVVHLIRDPRGTFHSMKKLGWFEEGELGWFKQKELGRFKEEMDLYKRLCIMTMKDFRYGKGLSDYVVVKYEDLVENLAAEVKHLFDFVGLTYTEGTRHYLHTLMQNGTRSDGPFGFKRNMKQTYLQWRNEVSPSYAATVEEACEEMMDVFGYNRIKPKK